MHGSLQAAPSLHRGTAAASDTREGLGAGGASLPHDRSAEYTHHMLHPGPRHMICTWCVHTEPNIHSLQTHSIHAIDNMPRQPEDTHANCSSLHPFASQRGVSHPPRPVTVSIGLTRGHLKLWLDARPMRKALPWHAPDGSGALLFSPQKALRGQRRPPCVSWCPGAQDALHMSMPAEYPLSRRRTMRLRTNHK